MGRKSFGLKKKALCDVKVCYKRKRETKLKIKTEEGLKHPRAFEVQTEGAV